MTKRMLTNIPTSLVALFAALVFFACTNSDELLYDESQSIFVDISVEMATSFDSSSTRIKADTVRVGDSLIFIANILPSKSIKLKRYLWFLDGKPYSFDFSFRSSIDKPGYHELAFILETTFGDTLSDTLRLWVSNPPILRDSDFFPAPGTQGIPTSGGVTFAWDAYDPDSLARLYYRIVIDKFVDTIVPEPHFTYWGNLAPLRHYHWWVEAINEFGLTSEKRLLGDFYTKGANDESGICGTINTSYKDNGQGTPLQTIAFDIYDTTGTLIRTDSINGKTPLSFSISPIKAGTYTIQPRILKYPEFFIEPITAKLFQNEVLDLDMLLMQDTTAPKIELVINGIPIQTDTIDFTDTLTFLIKDSGSTASSKQVSIYLESSLLVEKQSLTDSFTVVLPESARSWNTRQLDVIAFDASRNRTVRSYIINPSENWIKTNSDMTLDSAQDIKMFIIDSNPYGFEVDSCMFEINGKHTQYGRPATESICTVTVPSTYIASGKNTIRSIVKYTNGISLWEKWNIFYNAGGGND